MSQEEGEVTNRPAQTVASVKKALMLEKSKQEMGDADEQKSSNSENSDQKSSGRHRTRSTVLVRKRKSHTYKKASSGDKKKVDSDDESKIQEIENSCKETYLYKTFFPLPSIADCVGNYIKIIVESQYLTNENPAIVKRHLWGNEFYSSDSDVVCILQHAGVLKLQELPPKYAGLAVYFKVSKTRANYATHFKNGIKSRKNQAFEGHSLKFETAVEIDSLGDDQYLRKNASKMPTRAKEVRRKQKITRKAKEEDQDMSIVFSLSGEPMNKFNLGEFGDKRSLDLKISEALEKEVLYLESLTHRYELSYNLKTKLYEFKQVLEPLLKDLQYLRDKQVPLPESDIKTIFTDLKWSEILWGDKSLKIRSDFSLSYINGFLFISIEN